MKARIIITIKKELLSEMSRCIPPNFRSLFIETLIEDFLSKYSAEQIKEKVFKDFDRKAIKRRIITLNKKNDKINLTGDKNIEKEIEEMW